MVLPSTAAPTPAPMNTRVKINVDFGGIHGKAALDTVQESSWTDTQGSSFSAIYANIDNSAGRGSYSYSYSGEDGNIRLMDFDGDKVYTGSVQLDPGTYTFKVYPNGDAEASFHIGGDCNAAAFTFKVTTSTNGGDLDVDVCYGGCGEFCTSQGELTPTSSGVTIYADMTSLDKSTYTDKNGNTLGTVHVPGTMNSWQVSGNEFRCGELRKRVFGNRTNGSNTSLCSASSANTRVASNTINTNSHAIRYIRCSLRRRL